MGTAPAPYTYALFGNALHIYPVPAIPANVLFAFYFQSRNRVQTDASGTTFSGTYDTDACSPRLPTYLIEADLKWRWKKEKGLPYAEDQRVSESMIVNAVGRSSNPILNLDPQGLKGNFGPGIFVSPGSWSV
jgi:hypothetical protein